MNDHTRRYADASENVRNKFLDPITGLLKATAAFCEDANQRASRAETTLEVLRPVWAQGYTSDSQAAQATANALAEIWQILGVDNQTAAMQRLRDILP